MPMLKTQTADEATVDGEIQIQDSVNVSSAKSKNWIISNLLCDYYLKLFNQHLSHLIQEKSLLMATTASATPRFYRERSR